MPDSAEQDPRIYFAVERTFLAWIRTGIALMAFGFAIARFALFLRQLQAMNPSSIGRRPGGSAAAGVTLIVLGIIVNISAAIHHVRTVRELSSGTWVPGQVSRTAILLAALLAILGTGMAIYLLLLR
jgi:putative membrane protein